MLCQPYAPDDDQCLTEWMRIYGASTGLKRDARTSDTRRLGCLEPSMRMAPVK